MMKREEILRRLRSDREKSWELFLKNNVPPQYQDRQEMMDALKNIYEAGYRQGSMFSAKLFIEVDNLITANENSNLGLFEIDPDSLRNN